MAQTKGEGAGVGEFVTGTLVSKANLVALKIDAGADLRTEDDATREAVERALSMIQPLMYVVVDDNSGVIHAIVDGSQVDGPSLQAQLRAIGTDDVNSYNFATAAVTVGSAIVVS